MKDITLKSKKIKAAFYLELYNALNLYQLKSKRNNLNKKIIDSKSQLKAPFKLVSNIIDGFWISRDLSSKLAKRDLIAQYRQSILGYIWLVLLPVVNTIIWILVRKSGLLVNNGDEVLPYTLYVFSGTMVFQIFSEALQTPLNEVATLLYPK